MKLLAAVYNPPGPGLPYLAVVFNANDMSKVMVAIPASSFAEGHKFTQELANGIINMASQADDA